MRLRILIAVVSSCLSTGALAGGSSITSKVKEVHVRASDGLHWVVMTTPPSGRPDCGSRQPYYMIKDERSDAGKAQFAMLLSAQLSGNSVTVDGAGVCSRWGDGEDIEHVMLAQ